MDAEAPIFGQICDEVRVTLILAGCGDIPNRHLPEEILEGPVLALLREATDFVLDDLKYLKRLVRF